MNKKSFKKFGKKLVKNLKKTGNAIGTIANDGKQNIYKTQDFLKSSIPAIQEILFTRFPDQVKAVLASSLDDEEKLRPLFGLVYTVFFLRFTPGPLKLLPFIIKEDTFINFCLRSKDLIFSKSFQKEGKIRIMKNPDYQPKVSKVKPGMTSFSEAETISFSTEKLLKRFEQKHGQEKFDLDVLKHYTCDAKYEIIDDYLMLDIRRFGLHFRGSHNVELGQKLIYERAAIVGLTDRRDIHKDFDEKLVIKVAASAKKFLPELLLFPKPGQGDSVEELSQQFS